METGLSRESGETGDAARVRTGKDSVCIQGWEQEMGMEVRLQRCSKV